MRNRTRLAAWLSLAALAFTATFTAIGGPATASTNPGTNPPYTATPVAPVVLPGNCAGATDIPVDKIYDFSEPAGSTVFHETLHHAAIDDLRVTAPYTGVSANGTSVGFNNNGLLTTAANNFSPGTKDFNLCVGFEVNDHDGYNLAQWGTSTGGVPPEGFVKSTGWYCVFQGTLARAPRVVTGVAGLALNNTGYHVVNLVRHGSTLQTYFDGVLKDTKHVDVGSINLSRPFSLGGKFYANGTTPIHAGDLLDGRVARVVIGLAA